MPGAKNPADRALIQFFGPRTMAFAVECPRPFRTEKDFILSAMWKPSQTGPTTPSPAPEPSRSFTPSPTPSVEPVHHATASSGDQATIGKGLVVKGEISGSESLYIDGKVEG